MDKEEKERTIRNLGAIEYNLFELHHKVKAIKERLSEEL